MAGTGSEKSHQQLVEDTERWFLRRGIPHFIEDYSAGEDVFTRAIPILGLFFLVEMTGATNLEWRWWQNTLAVLGAIALVLGVWALINTRRGRRRWQAPDRVGPVELTLFVVVPALLPLLFGGQIGAAAATATVNLVVLATVYLVTSYGLISMTRWAFGQMFRQLGAVTGLLGRALPLLFLFSVTLFINTEVWQVASSLDGLLMALTIGLFVSIGLAFLLSRLPGEMRQLRDDVSGDGAADACIGTPLE